MVGDWEREDAGVGGGGGSVRIGDTNRMYRCVSQHRHDRASLNHCRDI
jgi:hypothetical protein